MRNAHFFNRVAPCLAILTIGAAFALPTASYAATPMVTCRAMPPNGGPDVPAMANGSCPMNYTQVQTENPGAIPTPPDAGAGGPGGGNGTGGSMGAGSK